MSTGKLDKNIALPTSWDVRPLGDVVQPTRPRIKPSEKPTLPFIGIENIEAQTMKLLGTVPAGSMKSSAVHFQPDDVLYGRLRPYLNKVYRPDFEGLCSAEFIVFPKTEGVRSRYLQYFLNSSSFASYASHLNAGDRPRVDFEQLSPYPFPVAPYEQQERIVAEIEKQFSRLDEAVDNLKRVKANLKRYKASVLKAAVEGKLTEDWRKQHPNVEPASKLLERILAERRKKWNGRGKYKEPAEMDASVRISLPDGWVWASIESLSTKVVDGVHKKPNYVSSGVPFVTVRNLTAGPGINLVKLNYVTKEDHEQFIKRADPEEGDVLISKDGTLGVVRVIRTKAIFSIFVSVALVKPVLKQMSDYLGIALSSPQVQVQMVPKGSGLQHIHLEDLRADCVPVPPLSEQKEIVAEVERRLSVIEEFEAGVEANLTRADRLRQSILAKAFCGGLTTLQ